MSGLSFNPAFQSAVLNTLREGVIHLALPEPEIAQRPDFSSLALRNLLGVPADASLRSRFKAAADLIRFAARHLPESDRPPELAPLWGPGRWNADDALKEGALRFLEDATSQAGRVLGEAAFLLSLNAWNEPEDPSHRSVLLDHLEETRQALPEQRLNLDLGLRIREEKDRNKRRPLEREREALRISFSKAFRENFKTASIDGLPMGFANAAFIWRDHARMLRRIQLVPETRFLTALDLSQHSYIPGLPTELFNGYPHFFLQRLTRFGWRSNYFLDVPEIAAMLPESRISEFDLDCIRLDDGAAQALADAFPGSRVSTLNINGLGLRNTTQAILVEAARRSGIRISIRI